MPSVDPQNEDVTGNDQILADNAITDTENRTADPIKLLAENTENTENARNTEIPQNPENVNYHLVKQGESLYGISQQYKTTVAEICLLNGISEKDILSIGQKIRYTGAVPSTATTTATKEVQNENIQPVYYRIKEGDTLGAIAMKYGISINKLCELNNITRTTILRIGRSLRCS
jgi:LysM repeat protein